jgi:alanine-synthesizing transaminase
MFADRTTWNLTPNRLSEALARARAARTRLFDLTASNPTQCGFRYEEEKTLAALVDPRALHYEPDPKGLRSAREAVARYYAELGAKVSTDDLILTTSTSEAYSFIFRLLCNAGEELLIPAPSYPLFSFLADVLDVKLAHYPLIYDHGWQIDLHALERAIAGNTRGIVVVNPNNPTGNFVSDSERNALAEICIQRNLALIADEVFLDFRLDAGVRATLASNAHALTFVTSGLSKIAGLPQMKMAWLLVNGPAAVKSDALQKLEIISDTFLSPNAPIQLATPHFLNHRQEFQKQVLRRATANLRELDRQLARQKACERLHVAGGWYVILRIPVTQPDDEFALALLTEQGVYVHPGHFFDFPNEGHLVLSSITPQPEFAEGVRRILQLFG